MIFSDHWTWIRKNEVLGWIKEGLKDFPISRQHVKWGIPVPNDPSQTIYVWVDALVGYLSGLLTDNEEPTIKNVLKSYWAPEVHIIGKDIRKNSSSIQKKLFRN